MTSSGEIGRVGLIGLMVGLNHDFADRVARVRLAEH